MIADAKAQARLNRLAVIMGRQLRHLLVTDGRLFGTAFTPDRARSLTEDEDLAERVEAFVPRFGRLQDSLGDKALPAWLMAHGERVQACAENLDRAERLALIADAQAWVDMRRLRNLMIHEYVKDPLLLASALTAGHEYVPVLSAAARSLLGEALPDRVIPAASSG